MVPQDDVVHRQLTVDQALGYAAELRLPPDTTKQDRRQVTAQMLKELEMTPHAQTRVDRLSGGQRKRASVAMELLTGGRVVVLVTHSLTYLDVCDQVLLLAPGGKTAFCGPPSGIGRAMGTTNWADIFTKVGADPDAANRRFLKQAKSTAAPPETEKPADLGNRVHQSLSRRFSTIARRQMRLIMSHRGYVVFLVLLNIGAVFMGTALTIRDLIGERAIFRREQAVGLSTTACKYRVLRHVNGELVGLQGARNRVVREGGPGFSHDTV